MRYRWMLAAGVCAATVWGLRGVVTRSETAAPIRHVAELAGGHLGSDVSRAQYRYVHSQPNHWRQIMGQGVTRPR